MSDRCDVLLVAAFPPELAALREVLGEGLRGEVAGRSVAAEAVGIGLVAAAAGTARCLATWRARAVVLLGTCGAYRGALPNGSVAIARAVKLVEPAVVEGRAAIPEPMPVQSAAAPAIADALGALPNARAVDVATVVGVTTDDALADALARASACEAEHLEAFAVAAACAAARVPFAAALGVANAVGSVGRAQWRANHHAASAAAIAVALAWLRAGAPGVP